MDNIQDIIKNSGGWMEGHTSFKNSFHGNGWIEKGYVIRNPKLLDQVTKSQAELINDNFPDVDLLVGPIVNGAIVASHVARHLNKEFAVTVGKGDEIEFHRMNIPEPSKKVVLIEDLVFTGNDVRSNIQFLKQKGFDVEGVVVWINRQADEIDGVKIYSLIKPPFEIYSSEGCPLCEQEVPVKYENVRE